MKNKKQHSLTFVISTVFLFLMAACSSTPKIDSVPHRPTAVASPLTPPVDDASGSIDTVALQRSLGLERNSQNLGYSEKSFNTCQAGYGFSKSHNCQNKYFVVIHFQLLCRNSEGTVQRALTSEDLKAISDRDVNWSLKPLSGQLQTDGEGFGQIRTIASTSQKTSRLKLGVGNDFLYMRANEITRVVTPQPWCNP